MNRCYPQLLFVFFVIATLLCSNQSVAAHTDGFVFPVGNDQTNPTENSTMPSGWYMTLGFGETYSAAGSGHLGEDFAKGSNTAGQNVYAVADGVIKAIEDSGSSTDGWGPTILIEHTSPVGFHTQGAILAKDSNTTLKNPTTVYSFYGHLDEGSFKRWDGDESNLVVGDSVKKGETIAKLGESGVDHKWGAHLHFEIRTQPSNSEGVGYSGTQWSAPYHYNPRIFISNNRLLNRGLVKQTDEPVYYWLQNSTLYTVPDPDVINTMRDAGVENWDWGKVITIDDLSKYTISSSHIVPRDPTSNGLLVRDVFTKRVYSVVDGSYEYLSTLEQEKFADVIDMAHVYFVHEILPAIDPGQNAPANIQQAFETVYTPNSLFLGIATDTVKPTGTVPGYYQTFEDGSIQYHASSPYAGNAFAVTGAIYDKWATVGYDASVLGLPIANRSEQFTSSQGTTGFYQEFEDGSIQVNVSDGVEYAFVVYGEVYDKWGALGYAAGDLGLPIGDRSDICYSGFGTEGYYQRFERGAIEVIGAETYAVSGLIYDEWAMHGYAGAYEPANTVDVGHTSWAGFPIGDSYACDIATCQDFEGGYIQSNGVDAAFVSETHPANLVHSEQPEGSILLSWQNNTIANGVNVHRYGSPNELIAVLGPDETSFLDETRGEDHSYTYYVQAFNDMAVSPPSNEVVDSVVSENTVSGTIWSKHIVVSAFDAAYSVHTVDVDGDGDIDVVGASQNQREIAWWENMDGMGTTWIKHLIDIIGTGAIRVHTADVDGDGDMDILAARSSYITWWENTDQIGTTWNKHVVDADYMGANSVQAVDIDGDGDMDILGGAYDWDDPEDDIVWWENTDGIGIVWTKHIVRTGEGGMSSVQAVDIDGDGDMDILGDANFLNEIAWWENTDGIGTTWTEHIKIGDNTYSWVTHAADVDGDGDMDILCRTSDELITWQENIDGVGTIWRENVVGEVTDSKPGSVYAVDIDGDGDMDVAATFRFIDNPTDVITWWENTDQIGTTWNKHVVDADFMGANSVHADDINGDGNIDIIDAGRYADEISWWENINGISGTITDFTTHSPIAGVTVSALTGESTQSTPSGSYGLNVQNSGVYTLIFAKADYETLTVDNVIFQDGVDTTLNVYLNTLGPLNIATLVLSGAENGISYDTGIGVSGGVRPYTFSIAYGNLPPGLELDPEFGTISGTPTLNGCYTFGVAVQDSLGAYAEREFTLCATAPLEIITGSSLPSATYRVNYFLSFEGTGGTLPYSFNLTRGTLPLTTSYYANPRQYMTLESNGNLTGIPLETGAFGFTVQITDASGRVSEKDFHLEVVDPLTFATSRLNDGIVGQPYNVTLAATGGYSDYSWSVYSGLLPSGLTLNSSSGQISGTPAEATYGTIVLAVRDSDHRVTYQDLTIQVTKPLEIVTSVMPTGLLNILYSEEIRIDGGVHPYTFSYTGQLPEGLTLDNETGILSGTPALAGFTNVSITVTDSCWPTSQSATQTLGIRMTSMLTITTSTIIPKSKINETINPLLLTAGGGSQPYNSWQITQGHLPDGVTLNSSTGEISGTPLDSGDFVFTVQVNDSASGITSKEFLYHVSGDLIITTGSVSDGGVNNYYSFSFEAEGGIQPYSWRLKSGTLPDGLSFKASTATISGKPTANQTYSFTIEVSDRDSPAQLAEKTYIIDTHDELYISTKELPSGHLDEAYNATLEAALGDPPYSWRIASGVLPSGLYLDSTPDVATLAGTALQEGVYTFTVEVSDNGTPVKYVTKEFRIDVHNIAIDSELKSAQYGVPYSDTINVTGGAIPYSWQITQGALPSGLSLNSTTGHISGISNLSGGQSSTFTVQVTDSSNPPKSVDQEITLYVVDPLTITTENILGALQGANYNMTLLGEGGFAPHHWSIAAGSLPDGLSLGESSGTISGSATECGQFDFTVQLADSSTPSNVTNKAYSLGVLCSDDYNISGAINGESGIIVNLGGTASAVAMTDSSGNFVFEHLSNGTYTVTPSKTGLLFSPASRIVTINNHDEPGVDFGMSLIDPCGDINGDSHVNLNDLIIVLKIATGFNELPSTQGECNGDGRIGMEEAIAIMKRLAI